MITVLKPLLEWIVGSYSLFNNVFVDSLFMGFVVVVSRLVSREVVGSFYNVGFINGRSGGSFLYWMSHFFLTTMLFLLVALFINVVKFISSIHLLITLFK